MTIALAILASGSGTNAQAMFNAVRNGLLDADIRLVVCNRPGAGVIARAADFGVPCAVMDHTAWPSREAYDAAVVAALREAGADTVALAGYMRMLSPAFLAAFPGRVLNIHPALLPAFPGVRGIADAHAWSVRITGCTVHFVDEIMDHGAVIIQAAVPHLPGESEEALAERIHRQEHRIYPQALQWLAEGRLQRYAPGDTAGSGPDFAPNSALNPASPEAPDASTRNDARGVRLLPRQTGEISLRVPCDGDVLFCPPLERF